MWFTLKVFYTFGDDNAFIVNNIHEVSRAESPLDTGSTDGAI